MKTRVLRFLWVLASIGLATTIWHLAAMRVPSVILPEPARVARELWAMVANGTLQVAVQETLGPMLYGFLLSIVVGVLVGLILGISPVAARLGDPIVYILWCTPAVALVPLIIIWFGIGFTAMVAFVFANTVWPIVINTEAGVREVDRGLTDVVRSLGGKGGDLVRHVVVPATVPYIMSGIRIAVGRAVVAIIVAQLLISGRGIGYMLQFYGDTLQLAKYFAPLLVTALIGIALNQFADWAERYLVRWRVRAFG